MKNTLNAITIFGLLIFSSLLQAQNSPPESYGLKLAENSHFRNWTYNELKSKISIHQEVIDMNVCDGRQTQLLPDLLKSNMKKNSLRIIGTSDKKVLTYIDGLVYDSKNKLVSMNQITDSFSKTSVTTLNQLRKITEGKRLLDLMQKSLYSVTIAESSAPRFEIIGSSGVANYGFEEATALQHFVELRKSGQEQIPFKQFGAGGNVRFKPGFKMQNVESDNIKRDVPAVVILGHELFHAFDGVRGLLDRRFVDGPSMEFIEITEYRATYFENQIRRALGRKYRKYYSDSSVGTVKSLLDKSNQPYLLPSPCL